MRLQYEPRSRRCGDELITSIHYIDLYIASRSAEVFPVCAGLESWYILVAVCPCLWLVPCCSQLQKGETIRQITLFVKHIHVYLEVYLVCLLAKLFLTTLSLAFRYRSTHHYISLGYILPCPPLMWLHVYHDGDTYTVPTTVWQNINTVSPPMIVCIHPDIYKYIYTRNQTIFFPPKGPLYLCTDAPQSPASSIIVV